MEELEEGEAFQYKEDDDDNDNNDNNIDPEIALSYIDDKIQNVLGHFQKDFEGGVSAENLGSKFGGYGSFLPTYERSPQRNCVGSYSKTPPRNSITPKSPNKLPVVGASQSLKVPSNILPSVKVGTASYSANALHKSGLTSGDVSVKQDSNLPSALVSRKSNLKDENSNQSGNLSDQRTLKVRIKVPDSVIWKNAAIYSGLGLDNSPSSSMGNSPEESGGRPPVSQDIAHESPTSILRTMTSFPVSGGALISPLHDSLLYLTRKDRFSRKSKPVPPHKGSQEVVTLLADELVSSMGNRKLLKGKEVKFPEKSERAVELKYGNDVSFDSCMAFSAKKKIENDTPGSKDILSSNLKNMPQLGTVNGGETLRTTGRSFNVPRQAVRDGVRDGLVSSDVIKEDSLESRSGQDSGKSDKINAWSGSVEKFELRALSCDGDASVNLRHNGKSKNRKTSALSKDHFDAPKWKEDPKVGSRALSKQKIGKQAAFHLQDEISMPRVKQKPLLKGKKSHGTGSSKRAAILPTKESPGIGGSGAPKDRVGAAVSVSKSTKKFQKVKLQKDVSIRDNLKDALDSKLEKNNLISLSGRPSASWQKENTVDNIEVEQNSSFDKSRERFGGKRVADKPIPGTVGKDLSHAGTSVRENALAFEVVPPAMDPILIEENWVCCDSCQKWRLLPYGTKPEQLPEKWLCSMLNWLPGKNHCEISEDETTKALNALPLAVGHDNLQNHANGATSGLHMQHVDCNHQTLDFRAASLQGKKKRGLKEIAKAGSNSGIVHVTNLTKNHLQNSVKSRSLNDMNKHPAEANLSKSSFHNVSKSDNLVAEQKDNHVDGGKQLKMKNKREADHYGCETNKKFKTEDTFQANKHHNPHMDLGRMCRNSKCDLSTKPSGKDLLKSNEHSFPEDTKCDTKEGLLVSVKKLGDYTQVSLDGGSLDIRTSDLRNVSMKKRKLKEWQNNQNGLDSNLNAEDSSESGLKKAKRPKILKSGASSLNKSNDKVDKKEKTAHILSSGSQDRPIDVGTSTDKDQKPRKHRRKFTSQQTLDGVDSLRKDLGSGQLSMTATSSSSKVSGSLKTRAVFDDVKSSPVESVSSSPLRTSFPDKLGSTGNILGKNDATSGGLPAIDEQRSCWDGEGDGKISQYGIVKKEKVSSGPPPAPFKSFPLDSQVGDASRKVDQTKYSDVLNSSADIIEHRECSSDLFAIKKCHDGERAENQRCENVLYPWKAGKGLSLQLKDNDRSSTSDFDGDEMKSSEPVNDHGDFSNMVIKCESEVDPRSHAPLRKRINNKQSILDKHSINSSKDEKFHVSRSGSIGLCSKDSKMENPLKLQECGHSDGKLSALHSRKWNAIPQENLTQDFDSETKGNPIQKESKSGTPKLAAHTEQEAKQDSQSHQSALGSQQEGVSVGLQVHVCSNGNLSKASRDTGNPGNKNGSHLSSGLELVDIRGARDLNAPSPGRTNFSSQTAADTLEEAKVQKVYADRLKACGFGFESNEINFQAALKFLHGASLLETCNEAGRQGEMTQIQVDSMTAKLFECCALEYERRHEMVAAALAYKCMEVAYWRVVYCKNTSLSRDRNELQACLQKFSQGESPSSSASDIDNLNNQATVDKATISKGTISHVTGNPVVVARNHSNFLWLLDFTQDVNFAVEASRKSQNAYSAANVVLEEVQNRDCIISVKKVIDFSFQDVEELIRLVRQAMEAITRAGLVGARD